MNTLPLKSPKPDRVAVASLVAGIAQCVLLLPATIAAIVCGHVARHRIRRAGAAASGRGYAAAGLTLGYVGLVVQALVATAIIVVVVASGPVLEGVGAGLTGYQFSQDVSRDASAHGLGSRRDPAAIARVVRSNSTYATAHLADGTPATSASRAQWAFSGWRVQLDVAGGHATCITLPETASAQPTVVFDRCR